MLNKITIGITQSLDAEFGEGIQVYIDEIEQGLEEPCFLITPLTTVENPLLGERYARNYPFMVQYFPQAKQYNAECSQVTEQLLEALEYITVDGQLIRGVDMSAHVEDGVLNFEVTYKMQVFKHKTSTNEEVMKYLKHGISAKE